MPGLPPYVSATPRDITIRLLSTDNVAEQARRLLAEIVCCRPKSLSGGWRSDPKTPCTAQRRILVPAGGVLDDVAESDDLGAQHVGRGEVRPARARSRRRPSSSTVSGISTSAFRLEPDGREALEDAPVPARRLTPVSRESKATFARLMASNRTAVAPGVSRSSCILFHEGLPSPPDRSPRSRSRPAFVEPVAQGVQATESRRRHR